MLNKRDLVSCSVAYAEGFLHEFFWVVMLHVEVHTVWYHIGIVSYFPPGSWVRFGFGAREEVYSLILASSLVRLSAEALELVFKWERVILMISKQRVLLLPNLYWTPTILRYVSFQSSPLAEIKEIPRAVFAYLRNQHFVSNLHTHRYSLPIFVEPPGSDSKHFGFI